MSEVTRMLEAIFGGIESGGYIAIVEVPLKNELPQEAKWDAHRQLYLATRPGVVPELPDPDPESAWYFAPVVFGRRERVKESALEGSALWMDLDTDKVDPFSLAVRPSIIVETSPGHHHLYWLLSTPLSPAMLEFYNRKLAYGLGGDKSGWDSVQLLRLPAGLNVKRGAPFRVRMIHCDPSLRYSLDAFAHLPEPPPTTKSAPEQPMPVEVLGFNFLFDKYKDRMSARLMDLLKRKQLDRSRALWFIFSECYRAGIPPEHCFGLVLGGPNDKFSDLRYSAGQSLWRDLLGGYAQAANGHADRGIIDQMASIRMEKGPTELKVAKIGKLLVADMGRVGMFYQTTGGSELFYLDLTQGAGDLMPVDPKAQRLRRFMLDRYAVNGGSTEWNQLYEYIAARCQDNDPVVIHRFAHYDPASRTLYVNKFDNQIYKIDASGYTIIPNGADGVLFLNPARAEPYTISRRPAPQERDRGLWRRLVLSCANLDPASEVPPEQVYHVLYSWILALFLKDLFPVKPILLLHGETGSGKTMLFKAVLKVLIGGGARPDAPYGDTEAFDNAVTNSEFIFVDNVDEYLSWLANKLALVATSYSIVKRKLYTNNESFIVSASCFVGITSRTPKFLRGRDDVAERLIPVRVHPFGSSLINEATIEAAIVDNRSLLWGEIVEDLMAILASLGEDGRLPRFQGNFRQGDFGAFLGLTGSLLGVDPERARKHVKKLQGIEALDDDPFAYALAHWVHKKGGANENRQMDLGALHLELRAGPGGEEFVRRVPSPRGLAIVIGRSTEHLRAVGIVVHKHGQVSPSYSFSTLEDENLS